VNGSTSTTKFLEIVRPDRGMNRLLPSHAIDHREASLVWNVDIVPGQVRCSQGFKPIGSAGVNWPLNGEIKFLDTVLWADGSYDLLCITTAKAYLYNTTNDEWDDVTPGGGLGGASTYNYTKAYMRLETGTEYWFFANGGKVLQWTKGAPGVMSQLLGAAGYQVANVHDALAVVVAWRRLWLLQVAENGTWVTFRTRYSNVDQPATWGATDYVDVDETPGVIMGGAMLGDGLVVYKDQSIHAIYAQTNPDYPFRKIARVQGIGTCSPTALSSTPLGHYFVDERCSNLWQYQGMAYPVPVGDRAFKNMFEEKSMSDLEDVVVVNVPDEQRLYCVIPIFAVTTGTSEPIDIPVYDWRFDTWSRIIRPGYAVGLWCKGKTRVWDDLIGLGDVKSWAGVWADEFAQLVKTELLIADSGGYTYLRTADTVVCAFVGYDESGSGYQTGLIRPEPVPQAQLFTFRELDLKGFATGCSWKAVTDHNQSATGTLNFNGDERLTFSLYGSGLRFLLQRPANGEVGFGFTRLGIGYEVRGERGKDG